MLGERVADWLAAWNEPDPSRRAELLGCCLADHIGMVQRMAGWARLVARGAPEACHGLVRFGWAAVGPGEAVLAGGTNVAGTDLDGRFRWLTGSGTRPGSSRTCGAGLSRRISRTPSST